MTNTKHAFFHSAKVQMLLSIARPMFQFIVWVMPLFTATLTYFIYGGQSPERVFQYAVLGSGFMGLWSSIVFSSASDLTRERYYGTLESIFITPTSFSVILMGKIFGNTIWGIVSMVMAFIYLKVLFGVQLPDFSVPLLIATLLIVIFAICVFAFLLALLFTLTRYSNTIMNVIEYPIFLLCGFVFPITILPGWLNWISYILPPTWAIEALRNVTGVTTLFTYKEALLGLSFVTLLYIAFAIAVYSYVDKKARQSGQLEVQ